MNIWRILRWQAMLIIKSNSTKGIKKEDWMLPDEINEKKANKITPKRQKEIDDIIAKMDRHHLKSKQK